MTEHLHSTEQALPQITVSADGMLHDTVHVDVESVGTPTGEQSVRYSSGFVEWFDDERAGEKVAAITLTQLRHFAILRQGEPSGIILDHTDGTRVASKLLGERGLSHLGLGEYVAYDATSATGLNAAKLPELVSRLQANIDDPRMVHIRGVGPKLTQFLAEYCDAMTQRPA